MSTNDTPLIVICGPTASGKSSLAVTLAKKYGGEIISTDSRQVYKYFNIGTGKISRKDMDGVPHHCLSFVEPKKQISVTGFRAEAERELSGIVARKHMPFLVGGTGQYITAITDRLVLPDVPPNTALRKRLAKMSTNDLFHMLKGLDPKRAESIDAKNPRRIIRAIEIVSGSGSAVPPLKGSPREHVLFLGIAHNASALRERVTQAVAWRLKQGVITEMRKLHKDRRIPWKLIESKGIDYRYLAPVARKEKPLALVLPDLEKALWDYAKRQMTWFRKDKRIHWIADEKEACVLIDAFLTQQ